MKIGQFNTVVLPGYKGTKTVAGGNSRNTRQLAYWILTAALSATSIARAQDDVGAWSREFSVHNEAFECNSEESAWSREFSVYNDAFECNPGKSAWSREFTVYNDAYECGADSSAWSREFSVYVPPVFLYIEVSPDGAGTTRPDDCTAHERGDIVDIAAIPAAGFVFSFWASTAGGTILDPASHCTRVTIESNAPATVRRYARGTRHQHRVLDGTR